MLFIKPILYVLVLIAYYFLGKKLNLTTTTYSIFNHKAVYGGGIIFSIILLTESLPFNNSVFFVVSIFVLSILSFFDDIRPISSLLKLAIHSILGIVAVIFILKLNFNDSVFITFLVAIFITFYTNANNFMDGINGMMITNNIIILTTLLIINSYKVQFINSNLLIYLLLGALIFFVFNFRRRALLISGDVGSIVLGFTLVLFVFSLYFKTNNIFVLALFITFSIETMLTLILRVSSKKNILESHKEHLYEVLVIKNKMSVLRVSSIYGLAQLLLSCIVLSSFYYEIDNKIFFAILILYILTYLLLRYKFLNYAKGD